jgi:hypothetical protein
MVPLLVITIATIVASLAGGIIGINIGGVRENRNVSRRDTALALGAIIGFVIGLFAGLWCLLTAATGAVGALIVCKLLFKRLMGD